MTDTKLEDLTLGIDEESLDAVQNNGDDIPIRCEAALIAYVLGSDQFPCLDDDKRQAADEEAIATAVRLVACWNALRGVPIERITSLPAGRLRHLLARPEDQW